MTLAEIRSTPRMIQDRLRQAAAWRLNGLLLERPRAGWIEDVEALAREVADAGLGAAAQAARAATEGEYLSLLGPGGAASPREVAYRTMEDPSRLLADLSAWYEAFAYRPRAEDPPDHLAVEAGFVGYLLLKEALALSAGDQEAAETTAEARARFLEERLAPFIEGLAGRLEGTGGHLELAARALRSRVIS